MAELYRTQQRFLDAKPLYAKALCIQRRINPKGHNDTAITHYNLALLYQNLNSYAKAQLHFKHALKIDSKVHGENSPEFAADLKGLAELYKLMERDEDAEELFQQAEAILRSQES